MPKQTNINEELTKTTAALLHQAILADPYNEKDKSIFKGKSKSDFIIDCIEEKIDILSEPVDDQQHTVLYLLMSLYEQYQNPKFGNLDEKQKEERQADLFRIIKYIVDQGLSTTDNKDNLYDILAADPKYRKLLFFIFTGQMTENTKLSDETAHRIKEGALYYITVNNFDLAQELLKIIKFKTTNKTPPTLDNIVEKYLKLNRLGKKKTSDEIQIRTLLSLKAMTSEITIEGNPKIEGLAYQAIKNGHTEIIMYLINNGFNKDHKFINQHNGSDHTTLLSYAIINKKLDTVEYLLSIGALVSNNDVMYATKNGMLNIFKLFEKYNSQFTRKVYDFEILIGAVSSGNLDLLKFLVENGVQINSQDPNKVKSEATTYEVIKFNFLYYLVSPLNRLMEFFYSKTKNPWAEYEPPIIKIKEPITHTYQNTALFVAAKAGQVAMTKYLLEHGASIALLPPKLFKAFNKTIRNMIFESKAELTHANKIKDIIRENNNLAQDQIYKLIERYQQDEGIKFPQFMIDNLVVHFLNSENKNIYPSEISEVLYKNFDKHQVTSEGPNSARGKAIIIATSFFELSGIGMIVAGALTFATPIGLPLLIAGIVSAVVAPIIIDTSIYLTRNKPQSSSAPNAETPKNQPYDNPKTEEHSKTASEQPKPTLEVRYPKANFLSRIWHGRF